MSDIYLNPLTDFGFKKLFGEEPHKDFWNYKLAAVYTIGILDFLMDDQQDKVFYHAQLKDQDNQLFYDKLNFIYLVLPRFTLHAHELQTPQEKWLYVFKHLHELDHIFAQLTDAIFQRLFGVAQIAQLPPNERLGYERSLKEYRDFMNAQETAHHEGYQEGIEEGEKIGLEKGKQLGMEEGKQLGLGRCSKKSPTHRPQPVTTGGGYRSRILHTWQAYLLSRCRHFYSA